MQSAFKSRQECQTPTSILLERENTLSSAIRNNSDLNPTAIEQQDSDHLAICQAQINLIRTAELYPENQLIEDYQKEE